MLLEKGIAPGSKRSIAEISINLILGSRCHACRLTMARQFTDRGLIPGPTAQRD